MKDSEKHSNKHFYGKELITTRKSFVLQAPGGCILKLIMAVIYGVRNKLECLSLNSRLGCKGFPGTNTLAYYGNRKLRPNKFYDIGPWTEDFLLQ